MSRYILVTQARASSASTSSSHTLGSSSVMMSDRVSAIEVGLNDRAYRRATTRVRLDDNSTDIDINKKLNHKVDRYKLVGKSTKNSQAEANLDPSEARWRRTTKDAK